MRYFDELYMEIKVPKRTMMFLLKVLYFDMIQTKEDASSLYKMIMGRGAAELVSKDGMHKLAVTNKKRIQIRLQNYNDNVIYKYTVRSKFVWKKNVQDCICEALIDIVYRDGLVE